ncbi:MAG: hypothetical protein N3F67_00850 [Acidilobaceae archaeon]|nr:hypothetical protein [Acidilobaceae archaeon]
MEFLREGVKTVRLEECGDSCWELCKEGAVIVARREELERLEDVPRECVIVVEG